MKICVVTSDCCLFIRRILPILENMFPGAEIKTINHTHIFDEYVDQVRQKRTIEAPDLMISSGLCKNRSLSRYKGRKSFAVRYLKPFKVAKSLDIPSVRTHFFWCFSPFLFKLKLWFAKEIIALDKKRKK